MEKMVDIWRSRRVFLTGHTGFKGSWLALWLHSLGAHLRGFALAPDTEPNLFSAASVDRFIEDIRGDIRDLERLKSALSEFEPEIVFHLAAQPLVRNSYADPVGTYATNVMGTVNLLEAVRCTPSVRAVVCVTTDKCYQNQEWIWPYRETDPLGGYDPYSSSKACAEIVSAAYRSSYFPADRIAQNGVGLGTARAGNVIGGGDWSRDRLIPDLIRGFQSNRPVLIRNPNAVRPWQHVLEPLSGYLLLAGGLFQGKRELATSFNFGPNDEDVWPVCRIADGLVDRWGGDAGWRRDVSTHLHEAQILKLDSSKAKSNLSWTPRLGIACALDWTAKWYRAAHDGADLRKETLAQIAEFQKLAQEHEQPATSIN